ncbi:MAG: hypothetical protein O2931_02020 [Planctomycetota bacterium]|nr:hypothetical protein [Planctomycetota bacterium]MDA1177550.1 hypothetical protein [Planctomycetota bacterium]
MLDRRTFLGAMSAAGLAGLPAVCAGAPASQPKGPRKKIAIVTTLWAYLAHGQHMGDRFLVGYPKRGKWHHPEVDVVSAFVAQKPESDLSAQRAKDFGFTIYPSIAEALRCGGDKLAVDGVVVIGEHGDYPQNEKGQTLYPRYEFFQEAIKVFEQDGRAVPMFNDKHLSYSWQKAAKMVADSKRLGFPFLAGSSVPVTYREPSVDVPYGAHVTEALAIGMGGVDHTAFHVYEGLQSMVDRRRGGETGVKSVQLLEGDELWQAGEDGRWSKRLLEAALSRSDSIGGDSELDSRPQDLVHNGKLREMAAKEEDGQTCLLIEYNDGLRAAVLMLNGIVGDFNGAVRLANDEIISTQFYAPPEPNVVYSARLMAKVEEMIVTGKAPFRVERTQLTSSVIERALDSRFSGHQRIATPELNISYMAPRESQFGDP